MIKFYHAEAFYEVSGMYIAHTHTHTHTHTHMRTAN